MRAIHLGFVGFVLISNAAFAQTDDNWTTCTNEKGIEEAISACTAVISSGQENGIRLARAYYVKGFEETLKASYASNRAEVEAQALSDLNQSLELDSSNVDALGVRSYLSYSAARYSEAIADLERVEKLNPNIGDSETLTLAESYEHIGDVQKALAIYDARVKRAPKKPELYEERGDFHRRNGQLVQAIADYTSALKLQPKGYKTYGIAELYYSRGLAKRMNSDEAGAAADIAKANAIYPGLSPPSDEF